MRIKLRRHVLGVTGLVGLFVVGSAPTASASLIFVTDIEVTGTGLGAVNTLLTVHDPGGSGNQNYIESGCINQNDTMTPCLGGVEGGDNTAINQVLTFSNDTSYAAVVNISETGEEGPNVTLTHLYLEFCGTLGCHVAYYTGGPILLEGGTGTGTGGSGFVFRLTDAEALIVAGLGSSVMVSGGVQFAEGSTSDGNETVYVIQTEGNRVVPEPAILLLMGTGLLAAARRRTRTRA